MKYRGCENDGRNGQFLPFVDVALKSVLDELVEHLPTLPPIAQKPDFEDRKTDTGCRGKTFPEDGGADRGGLKAILQGNFCHHQDKRDNGGIFSVMGRALKCESRMVAAWRGRGGGE